MVTMPMAFCASFVPWERAIVALEMSCMNLKPLFTRLGENRRTSHMSRIMMVNATRRPQTGEMTRPFRTFTTPFDPKTSKALWLTPAASIQEIPCSKAR